MGVVAPAELPIDQILEHEATPTPTGIARRQWPRRHQLFQAIPLRGGQLARASGRGPVAQALDATQDEGAQPAMDRAFARSHALRRFGDGHAVAQMQQRADPLDQPLVPLPQRVLPRHPQLLDGRPSKRYLDVHGIPPVALGLMPCSQGTVSRPFCQIPSRSFPDRL